MAYMLTAVVAAPAIAETVAMRLLVETRCVPLTPELGLVPIGGVSGQNFDDDQPLVLEQASLVWDTGTIVLGPLVDLEVSPSPAAPINQALRRLGVRAEPPAEDEFATVGLGRHRWTLQWLE
jgi:hypothetical protein